MKNLFLIIFLMCFTLFFIFSNCCHSADYNREELFGGWIDADQDGENTREEVLIRDSLIPVGFDSNGKVNFGLWLCPYTGTFTTVPKDFDIDHLVPLKNAWISGADKWSEEKRIRYANYLNNKIHLLAVTLGSNRQKGAKDISEWLPLINEKKYIKNWIEIKEYWGLCFNYFEIKTIIQKTPDLPIPENSCF